jgi:hypothetical protein
LERIAQQPIALFQSGVHSFCILENLSHVIGKVFGAHQKITGTLLINKVWQLLIIGLIPMLWQQHF